MSKICRGKSLERGSFCMGKKMERSFIEEIIDLCASEGRIFENEAQFKFDFAWQLKKHLCNETDIYLEHVL